jgi:hypothetical protein
VLNGLRATGLAAGVCLILIACSGKTEGETASWRGAHVLPEGLTKETADLQIRRAAGATSPDATSGPVFLDLGTLRSLPATTFETYDPWDEKRERFTGVSLYRLLEWTGALDEESDITVIAENGYESQIKVTDLRRYGYILAYMIDDVYLGEAEDLTKKGTFVIAINFDEHTDLPVEIYKSHLVWQVAEIVLNQD